MENPTEKLQTEQIINSILSTLGKDREREIISRRFGLFDRKETLEQIGELLGITRERVRQLEKSITTRLTDQALKTEFTQLQEAENLVIAALKDQGGLARVSLLADQLTTDPSKINQARIAFIGALAPNLVLFPENDNFYQTIALKDHYNDAKQIAKNVTDLVETVKKIGKPSKIKAINKQTKQENDKTTESLASVSKLLTSLNGEWGLTKWPTVNPKNIRDKIYVILKENKKQMHFSDIAKKIKQSDFKRNDVTTQAIHNELIKDPRFVLIGRGIYALKEWGYKKGTVSDVIADVLKKSGEPLHRDEIVKLVLKNRHVKETTILLNLQGKKQFKRISKATYALVEENV